MEHEPIYAYENDDYRLQIYQDFDPCSPREWDNLGTMVYSHRNYILGDVDAKHTDEYSDWGEWLEGEVLKIHGKNTIYLPLYIYDHSGVTMNTTGYSCRWDSGQIGWIYVTPEKIREEFNRKRISKQLRETIRECLESEVKIYDQYLTGDTYGFIIDQKVTCCNCLHVEYEHIESCWGYYGMDNLFETLEGELDDLYLPLVEMIKKEVA